MQDSIERAVTDWRRLQLGWDWKDYPASWLHFLLLSEAWGQNISGIVGCAESWAAPRVGGRSHFAAGPKEPRIKMNRAKTKMTNANTQVETDVTPSRCQRSPGSRCTGHRPRC